MRIQQPIPVYVVRNSPDLTTCVKTQYKVQIEVPNRHATFADSTELQYQLGKECILQRLHTILFTSPHQCCRRSTCFFSFS